MRSWISIYRIAACVIATQLLTSCNPTPEAVVSKYLDYTFLDNNGEKAYDLLSGDDKKYISREIFCKETRKNNMLNKKVVEKYEDFFYYEITDTKDLGDTIYVTAELNKPNAFNILSDLVSYAMLTAFGSLPETERMQAISQKFDAIMMSKNRLMITEEKVFKVIREKNGYKVYINQGKPQKIRSLKAQMTKLQSMAEENERSINFDKALNLYSEALSLYNEKAVAIKKSKLEALMADVLHLGQNKAYGHVKVTPVKVERTTIETDTTESDEETIKEVLILTYKVKNISEGQVFSIEGDSKPKLETVIIDNFGNKMLQVNQKNRKKAKRLKPGEERFYTTICEAPLIDNATKFLWKTSITVNNAGTEQQVMVSFSIKDVLKLQ